MCILILIAIAKTKNSIIDCFNLICEKIKVNALETNIKKNIKIRDITRN